LDGFDYPGSDIGQGTKKKNSAKECQVYCSEKPSCEVWTLDKNNSLCYPKYKDAVNRKEEKNDHISGSKKCSGSYL